MSSVSEEIEHLTEIMDIVCENPKNFHQEDVISSNSSYNNCEAFGEFCSKKLAVLNMKLRTDHHTLTHCCDHHGNHKDNTVHVSQDYTDVFLERLLRNRTLSMNSTAVKTNTTNTGNSLEPLERFPNRKLERLKVEALKHRMREMVKGVPDSHQSEDSGSCQSCKARLHSISEREFTSRKVKLLTEPAFTRKLEEHLYEKDSITMLGEIVSSCVRPSATGEVVWGALRNRMTSLQESKIKNLMQNDKVQKHDVTSSELTGT